MGEISRCQKPLQKSYKENPTEVQNWIWDFRAGFSIAKCWKLRLRALGVGGRKLELGSMYIAGRQDNAHVKLTHREVSILCTKRS